jgi:hypothetical protein
MSQAIDTAGRRRGGTGVHPRRVRMTHTDRQPITRLARRPDSSAAHREEAAGTARVLRRWSVAELVARAAARRASLQMPSAVA